MRVRTNDEALLPEDSILSWEHSLLRYPFGVTLPERVVGRLEAVQIERFGRGDGVLPLSYAQEQLWSLDRLEPEQPTLNISLILRLEGELDEAALEHAFRQVIARHEVLRSRIVVVDGRLGLAVYEWPEWHWQVEDLSGLEPGAREARGQALAKAEALAPFDLALGPLVRVCLVRLAAQEALLLIAQHHIVSDGWSVGVLLREVAVIYEAERKGEASPLRPLEVQYADYAAWQRQWLGERIAQEQLAYWRQQLAGYEGHAELPLDRARPAVRGYVGAMSASVSPELRRRLEALSRTEEMSLYMVLLGVFQLLVAYYSGQDDVAVGSPIPGRRPAQVEGLIGLFVNMLVLRLRVRRERTFRELLQEVRATVLEAYAHQDIPFGRLVEELQPGQSQSDTSLFHVVFAVQDVPVVEPGGESWGELRVRAQATEAAVAKFDQSWTVVREGDGLRVLVEYDSALFEPETVTRIVGHYLQLLEQVADDSGRRIATLELGDAAERRRVIVEWNETAGAVAEQCVHELFSEQAARTPDAVAVVEGERRVTYVELERMSNQLAHLLLARGVGPETRVALVLERSVAQVIAALGVLKAGGAYVSLDASAPVERLAYMVADSRARLVIAGVGTPVGDATWGGIEVVRWPKLEPELGGWSERISGVDVEPQQIAYVIYTSGSTGWPKGVALAHAGLSNLVAWHRRAYGLSATDRTALLAGLGFDASVWELWPYLTVGATVHVVPDEVRVSAPALAAYVARKGLTVVFVPTPLAHALLRQPWGEVRLRALLTGGEALRVRPWHGLPFVLVNHYGPTEATVVATAGVVAPEGERLPTIGRPVGNVRVYVLNAEWRAVPVGVPGELCIGGAGLARGYLDQPRLTAERFVPDSFSGEMGARLYRTGDRVRWLANGELEFLGRLDEQVKIRGYRIELGEIETQLAAEPGVTAAVVVARPEGPSGNKRLVGYVLPAADAEQLEEQRLRAALLLRLPEFMVPARIMVLERLPLTPNGKVDRQALSEPAPIGAEHGGALSLTAKSLAGMSSEVRSTDRRPPQGALERLIASTWRDVLGAPFVAANDDFLAIGGDSLSAAQVINRLQEQLGEVLHVAVVFEAPTVSKLADYLRQHYPASAARLGSSPIPQTSPDCLVDVQMLEKFRSMVSARRESVPSTRNRPAIFILAPPRSGTTLLRVMLGGNPNLFAPPELYLLSYATLRERAALFSGTNSYWKEGTTRAVMELRSCDARMAEAVLKELEENDCSTAQFYGLLQEWLGDRLLIDKSPTYCLDSATLRQAEVEFEEPLYIHLLRHPLGMIRSFEAARIDQILTCHYPALQQALPSFTPRKLGELVWLLGNSNALKFFANVPAERRHVVRFEDLVRKPRATVEALCAFLKLDFHPTMIDPYADRQRRMIDGVNALSRMLGDLKFHQHNHIDPDVAEGWRDALGPYCLGDVTDRLALDLGYVDIPNQ